MQLKIKIFLLRFLKYFLKQFYIFPLNLSLFESQRKLALEDSQEFIYKNSSTNTLLFSGLNAHDDLHKHCLKNINKEGLILEFGVFKGKSINFLSNILKNIGDNRFIYGFDSFKGFSEEWTGINNEYPKKYFSQNGKLPLVNSNVKLITGFIEESLPIFLKKNVIDQVAFINIDTDTYTPAKCVLSKLKKYFKSGTIILFDEFCGYPNWRNHEFKALNEELKTNEYEFIGFCAKNSIFIKAAIRIL